MRRKPILLIALTVLIAIAGVSCSTAGTGSAPPAGGSLNQPSATAQPAAESVTQPAVAGEAASGSAAQPPAVAPLAPICQGANTCEAPSAEQHEIGCVEKVPYTNVLVPADTEYEVVDKSGNFSCSDSGNVVDGKTVLTCHGKQLFSFDLKLSGGSCGGGATLNTGTSQCQDGYGYDSAQQCCAPVSGDSAGSSIIQVNLGGCPLPRQAPGG